MERSVRIFLQAAFILLAWGINVQVSAQPAVVTEVPVNSTGFVTIGDLVYFTAGDALWRTDGTAGGTIALKSGFSGLGSFRDFKGDLYFTNADNSELWRSDGTPSGTIRLHISDGTGKLKMVGQTNDDLFFQDNDAGTGLELYRTDGTPGGTMLVKDINPGPGDGFAGSAAAVGNYLFFAANNGSAGVELWKSDGSSAGTVMVKDINPGAADGFGNSRTVLADNNLFYFSGTTAESGTQPWVSDGTSEGTQLLQVVAVSPGEIPVPEYRIANDGVVYFLVYNVDYDGGIELWSSEGTPSTTHKIERIGADPSTFNTFRVYQDKVYFWQFNEPYGYLWGTDGTAEGTAVINDDYVPGVTYFFEVINDHMLSTGVGDSGHPTAFLRSDGTTAGTQPFYSLKSFSASWQRWDVTKVSNFAFFADHDGPVDTQSADPDNEADYFHLFQTDGFTTQSMRTMFGVATVGANNITDFNGKVLFTTYDDRRGATDQHMRLWMYDPNSTSDNNGTFTLVNADTDEDIKTLEDGDVITKAAGENISITFDPPGTVGSVAFTLDGSRVRVENASPYSLAGDSGGDYNPWSGAAPGSYTLTATPYSGPGGGGTAGTPLTIQFTIEEGTGGECTASGTILREYWSGIQGNTVDQIPVNSPPQSTSQLTLFEGPTNAGTNYGARVRGYICPPVTGDYTFWIASNDHSELWLSSDDDPSTKRRIASVTGATNPRQWDKYATQKSALIHLTTGNRYYIEALHKQGVGTDNLAVGWQLPDGTMERPIPGNRLSPFINGSPANHGTFTLVNADTDEDIMTMEDGDAITKTESENINIRFNPAGTPGSIVFTLNGSRVRTENAAPYSLGGDASGDYAPWSGAVPGSYTLTATPYSASGGGGTAATSSTIHFSIESGAMAARLSSDQSATEEEAVFSQISIYPNPARGGDTQLSVSGYEGIQRPVVTGVEIIDLTGEVIYSETISCGGDCASYLLNFDKQLAPGLYLVNMNTNGSKVSKRLLVK